MLTIFLKRKEKPDASHTIRVAGGLRMVAIDLMEEESDSDQSARHRENVKEAMDLLREAGFVFWDLLEYTKLSCYRF